jgi:ornithine carbamoyltransferase
LDFSSEEIRTILDLAVELKREKRRGIVKSRFRGKSLAMLFEKRSTRTRCAFETSFGEEGGHPVFLGTSDIHLGEKESLDDTARVLGRMFDAVQFRGYKQETAEILAEHSGVPVYNGLTDLYHPTQALADLMTLFETFPAETHPTIAYVGDGRNNVARSLAIGCAKLGVELRIVAPDQLQPSPAELKGDRNVTVTNEIDGVTGAHAVYTDVWYSMGEEALAEERTALLAPYQVNEDLMAATGRPDSVFLHCLPAMKGKEVTDDVIDGPRSRAWDQAENRKHTIHALMVATLATEY